MSHDWPSDDPDFSESLHQKTEELYEIQDAVPDEDGVIECAVLPLRDMVIFPRLVSPIVIGREASINAVAAGLTQQRTLIALTQEEPEMDSPGPEDFFPTGVEVAVGQLTPMEDGANTAFVQGRNRVEVIEFLQLEPFMVARARLVPEIAEEISESGALMRSALKLFEKCAQYNPNIPKEAYQFASDVDDPGWLADLIGATLVLPTHEQLDLLHEDNITARLTQVNNILARELHVLELEANIHSKVQGELNRSQREMYLREQMRAIQSELGEDDTWANEVVELREKIQSASLPEEVQRRALREISRINQMPPMSPEAGVLRTYIDWILDLPWGQATDDNLDIQHAEKILNINHYALKRAKERILEYIAVKSLAPKKQRQPILCFVGPPGTGKTSLGKSIAEALGRNFVRISLGGVRDEAEIRGHRRTYIGALPGRILQTMRRAETNNPLFMLDEVDKLSSDYRGDPASALLEVLDPEQNHAFSDHYLELPYDLSRVMFITTANWMGRIPEPLLDRMELIEFSGYIEEEKLEIAREFLVPRQLEETGLGEDGIQFSDTSLQKIIREYTYEAGVRNLEREIGRVCRKIARSKAAKKRFTEKVTPSFVEKSLGPPQFSISMAERKDEIGVATALAWTENGGDIMPIEVLTLEGKGNLQITGQIGEVMQESTQAALSYIKSRCGVLDIDPAVFENLDIHMHIPEGAIPKDGPSAGITIATALTSALTNRKTKCEVGLTGEITLRGRVLPVGGIREKVLAAHRAGLKRVIIPKKNVKDLIDIPEKVRDELEVIATEYMDQVLEFTLHPNKSKAKIKSSRNNTGEDKDSSVRPQA